MQSMILSHHMAHWVHYATQYEREADEVIYSIACICILYCINNTITDVL